jgi:hypothetical protein
MLVGGGVGVAGTGTRADTTTTTEISTTVETRTDIKTVTKTRTETETETTETTVTTTVTDGNVGQCDENYSGCVPIDSDVDCADGNGNGPSYVEGPVDVIGEDIYGLDANQNGVGCE